MLKLIINNEAIELGDAKISLVLRSPLAGSEGSYSYPFTFPATATNKRIFDNAHRIERKGSIAREYACTVTYAGLPFSLSGSMVLSSAAPGQYKAYLKTDIGKLYSDLKDLSLKDLDFDSYTIPGSTYEDQVENFSNAVTGEYAEYPYAAFVSYMGEKIVNEWDWERNSFSLQTIPWNARLQASAYLNYVLDTISKNVNLKLISNKLKSDSELNKLVLWNLKCISRSSWPDINFNELMPDYSVKNLLDDISVLFNTRAFVNMMEQEMKLLNIDDILKSNQSEELTNIEKNSYNISTEEKKTFSLEIECGDDDDDYYPDEIDLNEIESYLNLSPVNSETDLELYEVENINKTQLVLNQHLYYKAQLDNNDVQEVIPAAPNVAVYQPGEGDDLRSGTSPVCNDRITDPVTFIYDPGIPGHTPTEITRDRWLLLPRTELKLKSYNPIPEKLMSPRLLFYRGMVYDQRDGEGLEPVPEIQPHLYPFASSTRYDMNGNIVGNYELSFEGEHGLIENFWKQTLAWRESRKYISFKKRFTASELTNFDFSKKYDIGAAHILVEEIKITLSRDGIKTGTVKAWTI